MGQSTITREQERKSLYLHAIIENILPKSKLHTPTPLTLENLLLRYNFNSREFCEYYIFQIQKKIDGDYSGDEAIGLLAFELKKVNQLLFEPGMQMYTEYPSIKSYLLVWLSEEIGFLETKRSLERTGGGTLGSGIPGKIQIDMSVAELTCFVRALVDSKVILNRNVTELATVLSQVFVTKRSDAFSEGSFRRKYYNIEHATKQSVIDKVKNVLHTVDLDQ